ncbi:hypothetical protein [Desulfotruncus arcticus]|uniref:hypothetical protein n=1 Tax=Desulfotruncus arcticus TaxID=341036 RepID=UPI0010422899|nr:hypothetical protein [Desulfotruncus arcticus]
MFTSISYILRDKTNAEHIYTFREESPDSLDVLFLGSSHSYRFISPLELWNDYGIASYNLGTSEQSIPQSYFVLKQALGTQQPKLVVLDLYLIRASSYAMSNARIHQINDNIPRTRVWYEAVCSLVPTGDRVQYIFPIVAFHDRWKSLSAQDFAKIKDVKKGSDFNYAIKVFEHIPLLDFDETQSIPEISALYLDKIVELCRENDIELLLSVMPYPEYTEKEQKIYNSVFALSKEKGLQYLYLLDKFDEIGLDFQKDFSDSNHVNIAGALKITDYMGRYIRNNYDIPDRSKDPGYTQWNEQYLKYRKEIADKIARLGDETNEAVIYFNAVLS